uniref:Ig-like domain-containing protein n=1 Tax=Echeneis naucrates TaxID=173247 RepID=A0A665UQB0_ECHNA
MEKQHCDAFDYWGKGTHVTVQSDSPTAPTLFSLVQCGPWSGDITLGCLAHNFSPNSLTFHWTDADSATPTSTQYPVVHRDKYTAVSVIKVPQSDWDSLKSFTCSVNHTGEMKNIQISKPVSTSPSPGTETPAPVTFTMDIYAPVISSNDKKMLFCLVYSTKKEDYDIKWTEMNGSNNSDYKEGMALTSKPENGNLVGSIYQISMAKWNSMRQFNCHAWVKDRHDSTKITRSVSQMECNSPLTDTDFINDGSGEDEFSSLWSTTSTFIFLFITSLFYNIILSLVKMNKQ